MTYPPSLLTNLRDVIKSFPSKSNVKQMASLALLRMNEWMVDPTDMEESLKELVINKNTPHSEAREIIYRLSKLKGNKGAAILNSIINENEIKEEFKTMALACLITMGILDKYVYESTQDILDTNPFSNSKFIKLIEVAQKYDRESLKKLRPTKLLEELLTDEEIKEKGHLVHKLKAKDGTGRWAYYFVLVEGEMEDSFLKSIEGVGTVDLEDFGKVITSCYGEFPNDEVKDYLKEKYNFTV